MCTNPTNSISICQLTLPLIFCTSSILNVLFLVRHWKQFEEDDEEILRSIVVFLLVFGLALSAFVAYIFTHNTIVSDRLRILFILLSAFGLVKVYTFLYQKLDVFGHRLRSSQYKFAVVNYSIQLFNFLFSYSMQYIIYIPMYKSFPQKPTLDTLTILTSTIVTVTIGLIILLKGICLTCFEEDEENCFKKVVFLGQCCCECFEGSTTRKYYENQFEEQSWTTDYS